MSGKPFTSMVIHLAFFSVLPLVVLISVDHFIIKPLAADNRITTTLAALLIFLPKIVIFLWLGSQTMRFTEKHYEDYGNATLKTGLFACLLISVLILSVSAIGSIQSIIFTENVESNSNQPTETTYRLTADIPNKIYNIQGMIDFGISRDFRLLVEQNPGGERVVLDSQGGSIYEGRGLAAQFLAHQLDTHVDRECSSACALAFIGGKHRTLGNSARLGFHQYAVDYSYLNQAVPFYDPIKEQTHDTEQMLKLGIDKEFVKKIFDTTHMEMWYPERSILEHAGVVHSTR